MQLGGEGWSTLVLLMHSGGRSAHISSYVGLHTNMMITEGQWLKMMINYWPMMINTNPSFHWITSPPSATFAQQPTFDHTHSPTITRHQLSEQPINHYLLKTKTFHQRNTQIHSKNTNTHIIKNKTLFPLNHNASITRRYIITPQKILTKTRSID